MAKGKNKPKLTNKQIESHLNNLYNVVKGESDVINAIMKVVTLYIDYKGDTKDFEVFLKEHNEKQKKSEEIEK